MGSAFASGLRVARRVLRAVALGSPECSVEDKIRLAFLLYDSDSDGYIAHADLLSFMRKATSSAALQ